MLKIGIRREDKNEWEARVPLIPSDVERLVNSGIEVYLQPSPIRIFSDKEYTDVGATISEDLSICPVILAVKEIPINFLQPNKTYIFFSHTIKGQDYNMPLLQKMMDLKIQLIDYERIANEKGQRLIFFGRHAGLAGMIDSLWAYGKRLESEGVKNPFNKIKKTYKYRGLENAKRHILEVADEIRENGLPEQIQPFVCGFAGYGNVSQGAQDIFDIFPNEEITPEELLSDNISTRNARNKLFKVVFKEEDMVETKSAADKFVLQDYYDNPKKYKSKFENYLPQLSMLVNCIYWDTPYPRLITLDYLKKVYSETTEQKLKVIGDISVDIDGAIQCTSKSTESGNPVYVYNPLDASVKDGVEGAGPVIMAVDNLPCELAAEASQSFSKVLVNYILQLVQADYKTSFNELNLPDELRRAMILYQGKLTSDYKYLIKHLH